MMEPCAFLVANSSIFIANMARNNAISINDFLSLQLICYSFYRQDLNTLRIGYTVGDNKFGLSHKKSALTLTKIRKTQKIKMNFIISVV